MQDTFVSVRGNEFVVLPVVQALDRVECEKALRLQSEQETSHKEEGKEQPINPTTLGLK